MYLLSIYSLITAKGPISSEKYWYYFHCLKNVLCSILSFVFWIFPPLDTAVQLESADSKQNAISKYLFQDSFQHIFWAMSKMHHTFWKKATFKICSIQSEFWSRLNVWPQSSKLRQEVSKNSLFWEFLYLFIADWPKNQVNRVTLCCLSEALMSRDATGNPGNPFSEVPGHFSRPVPRWLESSTPSPPPSPSLFSEFPRKATILTIFLIFWN